jgi:hypothetical protein
MGILDKFKTPKSSELKNGSEFAPKYDAKNGDVPKSILISDNSPLHADKSGEEGFSLNGKNANGVTKLYSEYDDGSAYTLPKPTDLENQLDPTGTFKQKYNSNQIYFNPEFTEAPEFGSPNPTPKQ